MASELGYDAGFGRGTLPSEVAAFIAVTLARDVAVEQSRGRGASRRPHSSPESPDRTVPISPSCCCAKGYRVVGMTRRTSTEVHERIEHIVDDVEIVSGDLLDQSSITSIVNDVRPDEIYNLAAQSFVPASWSQPVLTGEFTALGVTRVLEAIRHSRSARYASIKPRVRRCSARSVEDAADRRRRPSIRAVRTASPKSTVIGSR